MTKELTELLAGCIFQAMISRTLSPDDRAKAPGLALYYAEETIRHLSASGCVIVKSDVIEKATHDLVRERLAWSDAIASRLGSALSDKEG